MKQAKIQQVIKSLSDKMNMNKVLKQENEFKILRHKERNQGLRTQQ